MTREQYDLATVSLDKILKYTATKEKIKRELPELEYDHSLKRINEDIISYMDEVIKTEQDKFDAL